MVTTFNRKDMISFGRYLLSDKRTELIKEAYHHEERSITLDQSDSSVLEQGDRVEYALKDRLSEVYAGEISNWSQVNSTPSFEYFTQIQEIPKEGGKNINPDMELMGTLGWELCGIHQGAYIYKRRTVN